MAGVPNNFQAFSNVLGNYDFVDIANGTGYVNFYAGDTVDLKLLSNFTFYAQNIVETATTTATNFTLMFDHDFDVLINRPLDIKGTGIINLPTYVYGSDNGQSYFTVTVRKWDGVTETDLATNDTPTVTYTAPTTAYKMQAVDLTFPLSHIKKGEYLRVTIQGYLKKTNTLSTGLSYAHDPKGRTTGWDGTGAVPSILIFQCPVRLNL